jgi:adenosine deaminase CECR1
VTLLDHIIAIVESIIAPMKRHLLRKRKKSSIKKMAKAGAVNGDTLNYKPTSDEIFIQCLETVNTQAYKDEKQALIKREMKTSWDHSARESASEAEKEAERIIWKIREHDRDNLFGNIASEAIPGPDTLDMGGQFLTNKDRIQQSELFKIARGAPKGCHLHLHFNAELSPKILMKEAEKMPNMFIRSTEPLLDGELESNKSPAYATCELVFNVMDEKTSAVDIFEPGYNGAFRPPESTRPWMKWQDFVKKFEGKHGEGTAEAFVLSKMILTEDEVYGNSQTTNG